MKATLVRDDTHPGPGVYRQEVWKLEEPLWESDDYASRNHHGIYTKRGFTFVLVSALREAMDTGRPETFIFGCESGGEVVEWGELPGSLYGTCDIEQALRNAGYETLDRG